MQNLVEDFLQFLRHERGQAEHTRKTYAAILHHFLAWAATQNISDWRAVELSHLMAFLTEERARPVAHEAPESVRKMSASSLYLEIAALRAFYRFAENEKLLPANVAEHLSLPRRWKRLPKALTDVEITRILAPATAEIPDTPQTLCDRAIL